MAFPPLLAGGIIMATILGTGATGCGGCGDPPGCSIDNFNQSDCTRCGGHFYECKDGKWLDHHCDPGTGEVPDAGPG
jgi:hypothetical protein